MPDVAHVPLALGSQFICEDRRKAFFPIPHRLMGEFKSSHSEEFRHLSVTQFVADSTQQNLEDDIGRKFQKIKGSAGAFIKRAMTILTAENGISQVSGAFSWGGVWGMAVRAIHASFAGKGLQHSARIPNRQALPKI